MGLCRYILDPLFHADWTRASFAHQKASELLMTRSISQAKWDQQTLTALISTTF